MGSCNMSYAWLHIFVHNPPTISLCREIIWLFSTSFAINLDRSDGCINGQRLVIDQTGAFVAYGLYLIQSHLFFLIAIASVINTLLSILLRVQNQAFQLQFRYCYSSRRTVEAVVCDNGYWIRSSFLYKFK
ncbi:hypothetical protein L2E82_33033 [Cichorium intybus]|uniref:Uncharacterized protein n=1 Tax=Cichorium intybus TaxID=13427 RepID=A0ACB9BIW1_CICIN|nr:hypothetical protein L2E82_33033 [Cichorium intybus]